MVAVASSASLRAALPDHVAIVMDGNGRWAQHRGLPRVAGHEAGARAAKRIIRHALNRKIRYLSLFAFGQENWSRPTDEVNALMRLLSTTIDAESAFFAEHAIRLSVLGDLSALEPSMRDKIEHTMRSTSHHAGMHLVLALNYSGRWDLTRAMQVVAKAIQTGKLLPDAIDQSCVTSHLSTAGLPDPDLLVRTSGELRLSNFMLWQLAYTELFFSEVTWPNFSPKDFDDALESFATRQRRFGGVEARARAEAVCDEI